MVVWEWDWIKGFIGLDWIKGFVHETGLGRLTEVNRVALTQNSFGMLKQIGILFSKKKKNWNLIQIHCCILGFKYQSVCFPGK